MPSVTVTNGGQCISKQFPQGSMIIEKAGADSAMDQERWRRITGLFHEALEREPESRRAFLDGACSGDTELRRQVELLLAQAEQAESFLEKPALEDTTMTLAAGSLLSRQF